MNPKTIFKSLSLTLAMLAICANAQRSDGRAVEPSDEAYRLVWADEFDYEGAPDPEFWSMETGGGGWGNNELQYYTDRAKNVRVGGGVLSIDLLKEKFDNRDYTSARVVSKGKKSFTYGKFEIRAKLPKGKGTWPAIWTLGENIGSAGWPTCGEIDIMEHVGYNQGQVHASIHTRDRNHRMNTQSTAVTQVPDCSEEFHVYGLEWTDKSIVMSVDGKEYFTYTPESYNVGDWPFDAPQYLLLNVAFGGDWGGAQGIDPNLTAQTMEVDYVRVYQKPSQSAGKNFLRTEGKKIVNDEGEVLLRGFGLGGWVLQEPYMLRLTGGIRTQNQFRDSLSSLVGDERTEEFYRRWWHNGIQKRDIDSIASWGFNHVRMPMHYNTYTLPVEKEPVAGENTWLDEGFAMTDSLLSWCEANKIYLILDLHAAPGGQGNDVAISDASPVKMWQDERNVEKAIALWRRLAERYRDEEWIGGYDVINEPNWGFSDPEKDRNGLNEKTNAPLKKYLMDVTAAIRQVDRNHMIIIEGNGWGNNYNGVFPLDWDDNTAISFHKYWSYNNDESLAGALKHREEQNAPLWMSESGENSNAWFTDAISLLEKHDIGWCWWTYKRIGNGTPMEIIPGEGYRKILDYWAGRGPRPTVEEAWAALEVLAENYKQENTVFHRDYIDAMFRQVATTDTKPWTEHILGAEECTVFATDYDLGRNKHAYYDLDAANYRTSNPKEQGGNRGGRYRNDGVDIYAGDAPGGNGYYVGSTERGEWLKFTLDVALAGDYNVTVCVAPGGEKAVRRDGSRKWKIRNKGVVSYEAGRADCTYFMTPGEDIAWIRFEPAKRR